MKKLKNWIINKLGGYTFDEYEEMKNVMIKHHEELVKIKTARPEFLTLRAKRIIPVIDGDWNIYIQQEIVNDFTDQLLDNKLIEWDIDNDTNTVTGTLRVLKPLWEPIICSM